MPDELHKRAEERAKRLGYDSFSEYAQFLLLEDCEKKPAHKMVRTEDTIFHEKDDSLQMVAEESTEYKVKTKGE